MILDLEFFFDVKGDSLEIVPPERLQASLGSVEGSITCQKVGVYKLEFDNSYSWAKGKNLKYKTELTPPK